jgi:hypothetical protein
MLPFTDEDINIVVGHEIYTFWEFFSKYHKNINPIKRPAQNCFCDKLGGAFVWVVMPFGVKDGPPTYQRVVTKAFHE